MSQKCRIVMNGSPLLLMLSILKWTSMVAQGTELQDYCIDDGFKPECPAGEVILMRQALYGRMAFERCLKYNLGLDCQSDVLHYMDAWCSGQRNCEVDIRMFVVLTNECPSELNGYLQASFACVKAIDIGGQCCHSPEERINIPIDSGSITSRILHDSECGETACPLVIKTFPGLKINISVFNFNTSSTAFRNKQTVGGLEADSSCFVHVSIKEEGLGVTVALCDGDVRKRHVYTSSTSEVEVRATNDAEKDTSRFILIFEATGCQNPIPPPNGHIERDGDHVYVRCTDLDLSWEIWCHQNKWHGQSGNCSDEIPNKEDIHITPSNDMHFSSGMAVGIILALAISISMSIILIGIACIRRHQNSRETRHRRQSLSDQHMSYGKPLYCDQTCSSTSYSDMQIHSITDCGTSFFPASKDSVHMGPDHHFDVTPRRDPRCIAMHNDRDSEVNKYW